MKAFLMRSSLALAFALSLMALPATAQDTTSSDMPPETSQQDASSMDMEGARQAADDWLVYVDEGETAQGYEDAADAMKEQMSQEQWAQRVEGAQSQTGALDSREFNTTQSVPSPPQDPEGQYVAVLYDATYENLQDARETVVLIDEDGTWKVAGYMVQPASAQGMQGQNPPAPEDEPQTEPEPSPQPEPTPEPQPSPAPEPNTPPQPEPSPQPTPEPPSTPPLQF